MKLVSLALVFLGYVLVYASTAAHGRFALHPWLGVVADAYTGDTIKGPAAGSITVPSIPGAGPSSRPGGGGSGGGITGALKGIGGWLLHPHLGPIPIPGLP